MKRLLLFFLFATLLIAQRPALGQTTVNFTYTGAAQTFTVPTGVTSLSVVANGAQGGSYDAIYDPNGGLGGRVSATLMVLPGATLYIYVGGQGNRESTGSGGYNGGGESGGTYGGAGGGGGTDIRTASGSLSSRLLVAGGGGGGSTGAEGGVGGGLTGGPGGDSDPGYGYVGGGGGTSSSGGAGYTGAAGMPGTIGQGGSGGYFGGGGGGGYYGGGGGGNGSGGGGGSSYTDPTLASGVVHTQGANTGNGSLQIIYVNAPVTPLTLTPSASPATLLTTESTTLAATVSGGTLPYSYTFSGPGTITPSGNTATVSGLPAGVQTFTVVASDATTPISETVSGTVSVTVTQANTAPTVANPLPDQTVTVEQVFSYVIPANTFTDAETPTDLTLLVSGLPAGLTFIAPATISGTPTATSTSTVMVTANVTATDPGGLSVSTTFTFTVNPAVAKTITVSNTTPTQICGSKGTSVVVNFSSTGTYTDPFTIRLVQTKKEYGYSAVAMTIASENSTNGTATLQLYKYYPASYYNSSQESLSYKVVVSNGSVTSPDYAVTVLLPTAGSITVQNPTSVTSPGQTIHLSTPAAAGFTKNWYSHTETQYWQDGTLIAGQTGDNLDDVPTTSTYYSVVYTETATGCSNQSARVRIPFTITITGTSADGVYNEGRGVHLDAGATYGGTQGPNPLYFVPEGSDVDTKVYSSLWGLYTSPSMGYFIRRKNNIWEVYYGAATYGGYGPFGYTRIYHTKNEFPTINSGGRVAAPGLRTAAVQNTRPPETAVWIKDADSSEQTLTLTGVSEENGAMPVSLTKFSATLTPQKQVALSWQTAWERNADYFSVERSADLITFEPIARVQASGTATWPELLSAQSGRSRWYVACISGCFDTYRGHRRALSEPIERYVCESGRCRYVVD